MSTENNPEARRNAGLNLKGKTIAKLDETAARLGTSRAAVVEALTWSCADHLNPIGLDATAFPADHRGKRGEGRRKKNDGTTGQATGSGA